MFEKYAYEHRVGNEKRGIRKGVCFFKNKTLLRIARIECKDHFNNVDVGGDIRFSDTGFGNAETYILTVPEMLPELIEESIKDFIQNSEGFWDFL